MSWSTSVNIASLSNCLAIAYRIHRYLFAVSAYLRKGII